MLSLLTWRMLHWPHLALRVIDKDLCATLLRERSDMPNGRDHPLRRAIPPNHLPVRHSSAEHCRPSHPHTASGPQHRKQGYPESASLSGDLLVEADAVVAGQAGRTAAADPRDPFDADSVPDLDVREVGSRTQLDDFAYTLVPADLTRLRGEWEALPRVGHDAEVGVADAGVYKDLARPWLGHVEVDELCRDLARLIVDRGLVLLR
ncbi:alcohol dehydrogenase [Hortaea werneckii]|nr:alcohol dehydrogenase [Hortaea werneckii]